jgi:hypothetical protein
LADPVFKHEPELLKRFSEDFIRLKTGFSTKAYPEIITIQPNSNSGSPLGNI